MNKRNDNTDSNGSNDRDRIGFDPEQFLQFIGHIAKGNLVATVRLVAVCEALKERLKETDSESEQDFVKKLLGGLGFAGLILSKQSKDLSDVEDSVIASCKEHGREVESIQSAFCNEVIENHGAVGREWLKTSSGIKEVPDDEPLTGDDDDDTDNFGPADKGRFN